VVPHGGEQFAGDDAATTRPATIAATIARSFQHGLGMTLVSKSDQSTGNSLFASYVLQSHELVFAFTAPYAK
jgi:4-hydroxyphenylpyruvate dioxygenase